MAEPVAPTEVTAAQRRLRLVKFGAVVLVMLVGAGLVARGYDVKGAIEQGLTLEIGRASCRERV